MSDLSNPNKFWHKNPDCQCRICNARRRQAQAISITDRNGPVEQKRSHQAPINADLPPITVPGRSIRNRIEQWAEIRLKEPGVKNAEIAKRLGITPYTLASYICTAGREGWLKFDDPISRIDHEIIPKVIDNISAFLDAKDKQVTIETAKGTIFRTYQEAKGISDAPQTVLALKIETVGVDEQKVITGHVVGRPREISEEL